MLSSHYEVHNNAVELSSYYGLVFWNLDNGGPGQVISIQFSLAKHGRRQGMRSILLIIRWVNIMSENETIDMRLMEMVGLFN